MSAGQTGVPGTVSPQTRITARHSFHARWFGSHDAVKKSPTPRSLPTAICHRSVYATFGLFVAHSEKTGGAGLTE